MVVLGFSLREIGTLRGYRSRKNRFRLFRYDKKFRVTGVGLPLDSDGLWF